MGAAVEGLRTDGSAYRAAFELFGYEVAGPWLAFGMALAAFGMALERPARRHLAPATAAVVLAVGAWFVAGLTPLRTLTSFIPSDVQVDYGSEFASITFSGTPGVWPLLALAGALGAVALTWFARPDSHSAVRADVEDREETSRASSPDGT
jgi:hypothetical protein